MVNQVVWQPAVGIIGCCNWYKDEALGIVFVFLLLTAAYYLMTSKVTAKASVLFTTTCAFGMLVSLLQSIGIIGTMTVEFPVNISAFFGWFSILLLDLDNFGFACLAGNDTPLRYLVAVLFFPAGIAWFMLNYGAAWTCEVDSLVCPCTRDGMFTYPGHVQPPLRPRCIEELRWPPSNQALNPAVTKVSQLVPKYRWDFTKVASCMGQFLQVRRRLVAILGTNGD